MADFDPDAYLATPAPSPQAFNPDAYLSAAPAVAPASTPMQDLKKGAVETFYGPLEAAGRMAYGAMATPVAGLAGLAQGAYNVGREALGYQPGMPAGNVVENIMTAPGQPQTAVARNVERGIGYVMQPLVEAARARGRMISEAGAPVTGAIVSALPETAMTLLAPEARGAVGSAARGVIRAAPAAATTAATAGAATAAAENAARQYIAAKTSVAWNDLPNSVQQTLTEVAKNAKNLDKLDPKAIERLATLRRAGVQNATVGQLTRNPLQQTREMIAQQSEGGQVLRDLTTEQNKQLVSSIESLRGRTTPLPPGSTTAGRGVREAVTSKLRGMQRSVTRLYGIAERNAGDTPVQATSLGDYVNNHADPELVGYVTRKLPKDAYTVENGQVTLTRDLTLKELEIVRKAATAAKKAGGDKGYYAGEVTDLIDDITKDSGGEWYAKARAARRKVGEEFERTKAVNDIIRTRGRSREQAVALEDVWRQSVVRGSVDDLLALKKSLLGGSPIVAKKGAAAFDDLRAATADYLLEKATRSPKNSVGDSNVQWNAFRNAVNEIGPEKLEVLFGKAGAKKVADIVESLEILKTEAPNNWRGSTTFKNMISMLDTLGGLGGKYLGTDVVAGAVKGVAKLKEAGEAGRVARKAVKNPIEEAARRQPQTLGSVSATMRPAGYTAPYTAGQQDQQQ